MIGIVTTYKARPNYTRITFATMREALRLFNKKVYFFFYDDASTTPIPEIVTEFGQEPNVASFKLHRNEVGLGAEWGNIDAITKCFETFPTVSHVLILDNDLCVHPQALFVIQKMVEDIPSLGFGSIFNSNVFPEGVRVKNSYVIKDVNPGLGGVIQRDAWFWHLEKSKGTKLNKNPKQPGWDWNLSAWMKDSGGRWNVYATHQSYVEHIGSSGTNVREDFMTRSRRFYDVVDDGSFKYQDGVIDILMPVKDLTEDALERMRWCMSALKGNGVEKFRLCISDSSKASMRDKLKTVIGIPFEYFFEECHGLFNRSRVINNGVRHLVRSDPFIVMDTDIIVPSNYLDKFMIYYKENKTFVVGRLAYLKEHHPWSTNWGDYTKHAVDFYYNSGFFICNLPLFNRVNGFDESYDGWGAEDDDLNIRITVTTQGKIRKLVGMELTCWHLFHPRKDVVEKEACDKNRKIYWKNKPLYENGSIPPDTIKGLVDKRRNK
jgi:hypothetical protein